MTVGKSGARKKPGRPRKYGPGRINATVRFTPTRYAQLKAAADSESRSVSEEVERRVDLSFLDLTALNYATEQWLAEQLEKARTRIAELEAIPTLSEEAIERAVTKALAKARLTIGENGN